MTDSWQSIRKNRRAELFSPHYRWRQMDEMRRVLWQVRRGWGLAEDWREQGVNESARTAHEQPGSADVDYLVWLEIDAAPVADWEPARGPIVGWRAALESWWAASLQNERDMETLRGWSTVSDPAGVNVVDASDEWWEELLDRATDPWPGDIVDLPLDQWTKCHHAQLMLTRLDHMRSWYEGGLARGGVDIDWLGRYRARVQRWRFPRKRMETLALLDEQEACRHGWTDDDDPSPCPLQHTLPKYWPVQPL